MIVAALIALTLLAFVAVKRNEAARKRVVRAYQPLPYRVERSGARRAGEAAWRDSGGPGWKFGQGGAL